MTHPSRLPSRQRSLSARRDPVISDDESAYGLSRRMLVHMLAFLALIMTVLALQMDLGGPQPTKPKKPALTALEHHPLQRQAFVNSKGPAPTGPQTPSPRPIDLAKFDKVIDQQKPAVAIKIINPPKHLIRTGEPVVLVARLFDVDGRELLGAPVQWVIERTGVGYLRDATHDADGSLQHSVTSAQVRTLTEAKELPFTAEKGEKQWLQPGDAWCVVDSPVAGDMVISALAPTITNPKDQRTSIVIHWDNAQATFPAVISSSVHEPAEITAQVTDRTTGASLPNYRVRFSLENPEDTFFAGPTQVTEALTDASGVARVHLRARSSAAGPSTVLAQLLGQSNGMALPALVLDQKKLNVTWRAPKFDLSWQLPEESPVQEWVAGQLAVKNIGDSIGAGQILQLDLGADLQHEIEGDGAWGQDRSPLDGMTPGETRVWQVRLRSPKAGERAVRAGITGTLAHGPAQVARIRFVAPRVSIHKELPPNWQVGQKDQYRVMVVNDGTQSASDLTIFDEVPPELKILDAEGTRRGNGLEWRIERLPPGKRAVFNVTAMATAALEMTQLRTSLYHGGEAVSQTTAKVQVEDLVALAIELRDQVDPVTVTGEVVYRLSIKNNGAGAARQVRLAFQQPEQLEILDVEGRLPIEVRQGRLITRPIDSLAGGEEMVGLIRARAQAVGEARLTFELAHESLGDRPLRRQESTTIYVP